MKKMKQKGFTLMELLVVITIIIVLSGMGLAAYFRFSQRQAAMDDARNFTTTLRRVQAMAKNLVYPEDCASELSSYQVFADCVTYDENCQEVSATVLCKNAGGNPVTIAVFTKEKVLSKASFSTPFNISFAAGSGSIDPVGEFPISNNNDSYTVVMKTDKNGNISTKGYESYP